MSPTQADLPAQLSLYRHPQQCRGTGMRGTDLKTYLAAEIANSRCVELKDDEVEGWVLKKTPYPEELKGKKILLLTSSPLRNAGYATSLEWLGGEVCEVPVWLGDILGSEYWVLLRRPRARS